MIVYLTGVPGSGKSLRTMWWLNKEEFAGRPVYSNMEGPDGEGDRPEGHQPLPDDWRECEDGCVIVVDEAQHKWPQRGPSKAVPADISALDTHRHRGIDFILTTQRPTGVDHHVRGLIGKHEHLRRKAGLEASVITMREEAFDPNDAFQVKSADQFIWRFPKDLYGQYKSSVEHTKAYKFRMPRKLIVLCAIPATLFTIGIGVLLNTGLGSFATEQELEQAQQVQQFRPPAPPKPTYQRVSERRISGCVTSPTTCYCIDDEGYRVIMDDAECRNASLSLRWQPRTNGSDYVGQSKRMPEYQAEPEPMQSNAYAGARG